MSYISKTQNMSYSTSFYSILLGTTILIYCLQFSIGQNNKTDCLALRAVRASITDDPLGIMGSWNDTLHCCEWHGVKCGRRHQRVTAVELNSSGLAGTLSPFIGNLSFLRVLNLLNNSFTGTIPPEIGRLHRLEYLYLFNNSIGGVIPSNLSQCSSLISLRLPYNKLVGEIPPELGLLSNLNRLSLTGNNLRGPIPSSLGNLSSLTWLAMTYNNLIGTIPASLGSLKQLTILALSVNKLSGIVPHSIFNLSLLTVLDLGTNHFLEGSLPLDIGTMLPNIQFFSILDNEFSGSIPASISNCSNLDTLELGTNNFRGQVPCLNNLQRLERFSIYGNSLGLGQPNDLDFVSCLANATMLKLLIIGKNYFGGTFPRIICNFSMLSTLSIGMNKIAGQIPTCIENLANLRAFGVNNNQLSGVIPADIGKLQNLQLLDLSANKLSGHIPSCIGNLTQLTQLSLHENNLEGLIPSTIGNFRYLLVLDLSQNQLRGKIPSQLFNLYSSTELDLSHNPLTGSLPIEVGQLKNLVFLSVADTMLSGQIPNTLASCMALESLFMQGNRFQGVIPPTFSTLRGISALDLSRNNISGQIPKFLIDLPLDLLNLSYNNLEGAVPIGGIFSNITGISVIGNGGLCGGMDELKLPPCKLRRRRRTRRLIIPILFGVSGVLVLVAFISLIYGFCLRKGRKEPKGDSEISLSNLSYQDILKATNGFSTDNLIGSGAFGIVYKAKIGQSETFVAIKIFNLARKGASKSFRAECQVLKSIRHRNLVKVITACSSIDNNGNDFKALVYEYMANGSLEDWLHESRVDHVEGTSALSRNLNLAQRIDIVVDVAFALEYLHYHCGASVIHCDLKPSNVLLDEKMVAHAGDFGLAKFLSNGITSTHDNQSSSIGVGGTIGYAPPEYGSGNKMSTEGDVYSYGILVLEMFTGKKPTDDMFKDGLSLHSYIKAAWPKDVMEVLDHVLLEDIIVGEETNTVNHFHNDQLIRTGKSKVVLEALIDVLGIALFCSDERPQERLDMSDVAAKLSTIRNKLRGTGTLIH